MSATTPSPSVSMQNRFAWAVEGLRSGPDMNFDHDLADFASSAVVPTKGALLPEWLMVIPRHVGVSLASLSIAHRAEVLRDALIVQERVAAAAGSAVLFEHGASRIGSIAGCGVDQAHLHVVGLDLAFADWVIASSALHWATADVADPWAAIPDGADYLMLIASGTARYAVTSEPISQFFRKKVAEFVGRAAEWDYRQYHHADNAKRTARLFASSWA